jgi:hypothetical protein
VLFASEPGDALAGLLRRYSPAARPRGDRLVFGNGVWLYGPVEITPEIQSKAKLPPGHTVAYYTRVSGAAKSDGLEGLVSQDGERMVRGLAARLGGTVHDQRPPMKLDLEVSVFSAQAPPPAEQVIDVMQPYVDWGKLFIDYDTKAEGAYFLVTEEDPRFFVVFMPARLSSSKAARTPPAVRVLQSNETCRWTLHSSSRAEGAPAQTCLRMGAAALALASRVSGIAVDTYNFPIDRAEDLLPR